MSSIIQCLLAEPERVVSVTDGCSGLQVFRTEKGFLKIGPRGVLERAAKMQAYFASKGLAGPVAAFEQDEKRDYLLVPPSPGRQALAFLDRPEWVAGNLGQALRRLHELDALDCPIQDVNERAFQAFQAKVGVELDVGVLKKDALLHGDACLPNVFLDDEGVCGYIDLGEGGLGDRHFDLYWALWSMEYNFKTDRYSDRLLDAYGRDAVDEERWNLCARLSRCAD